MIHYSNIKRYDDVDFNSYLNYRGFSHSYLKSLSNVGVAREFVMSDKIMLGSLVDGILTQPDKVDMSDKQYAVAKDIAAFIRAKFPFIDHFDKQPSYTATMKMYDFEMPIKGRLDYLLKDKCVIDLKVTQTKCIVPGQATALIQHMGYNNQLWHYARLANVKDAYLIVHSVPARKTHLIKVDVSATINDFWANQILNHGRVNGANMPTSTLKVE